MAQATVAASNPFALMMNPQDVLRAVEQSDHLGGLKRRVYRPLDKPLIPRKGRSSDLDAFDREVEMADDEVDAGTGE